MPSPLAADTELVTFTILAGGQPIPATLQVRTVAVDLGVNRIPSARIVIFDGGARENFPVASSATFSPGAVVKISAGYQGRETDLFTGLVVQSAIQQTQGSPATFTVTCRHPAIRLTVSRSSALGLSQTDATALTALVNQAGLRADIPPTTVVHENLTQFATSDWDFLMARAQANGRVVQITGDSIAVKAPDFAASPVLSLTYGVDVLAMDFEQNVLPQHANVTCEAWEVARQQSNPAGQAIENLNPLGSDSASALAAVTGNVTEAFRSSAPLPQPELAAWASAKQTQSALAKIRGTVQFQGSALATPASLLELAGFGARFDGRAFVSRVAHTIENAHWTTTATIGLDPGWLSAQPEVSAPRASALLPAISGLQIGLVKNIVGDPKDEFRVEVSVPVFGSTVGVWARLAQPYASDNAGTFFYPEIGDEVVLAFLDSDPRFPVIVGSLHSQLRPPSFPAAANNTDKAIVTKGQLKLVFDDQKKAVTLSTPERNQVTVSDEAHSIELADQNGNVVTLGPSGISLNSINAITLTSKTDISLVAGGNIGLKASNGSVKVDGLTVVLSGNAQLTATGGALATFASGGETVVKGAIVRIN